MQIATVIVKKYILMSMLTKSTISIPARLTTFATQKKNPLIITEEIFDFYISMKAKETKEL